VVLGRHSCSVPLLALIAIRFPSMFKSSRKLWLMTALYMQGGELRFDGKTPHEIGYPNWRSHMCYVSQTRVNFKGTPAEFYFQAQQFASQKGRPRGDLPTLVHELGLEQVVLNQAWTQLSVKRVLGLME
jgi:hypothetical protein